MMDTHESWHDYDPVPTPPKTGVQVAIILCSLLIGALAVYKLFHGTW